jgi:predicted esterase
MPRIVTLSASVVLSLAATGCGSSDDTNRGNNADPSTSTGGAAMGGAATGAGGEASGASGGSPATGTGGTVATGANAPAIPALTEQQCPPLQDSTVTFMGLAGVQIAAGAKPAAATAPLVFYWHGTGSNSGEFAALAGPVLSGVKDKGGVLVSFQGTTGGDLYSGTNIFGEGDLKLVDQLVACAVRDHNVDPRQIFTMGCSAGGLFAASMAALRSSYVAAAAPNSGGWVKTPTFQDAHTPALMTVHGMMGKDVVIVDFAQRSAIADAAFKMHGGFVIDCDTGGNHCGGAGLAGAAWEFFQTHPFGVSPEPWATMLPASFPPAQCKIIQ